MTVITVTNKADKGKGSLREAIKIAKSGDTIRFDANLSDQTITLNDYISIKKSLTLDGSDAPGLTISGGEATGLFRLNQENQKLTVKNLTLADSYDEAIPGGAIWARENSKINIENTKFINNVSDGAALHAQKGSDITVTNSTFDGNDGAKISNKGYSTGAISLFAYGSLTIKDSVFTNNKGYGGGALHVTSSDLIVEDSVFIGNDSTAGANKDKVAVPGGGGAIYLDGASVPNDPRFYKGPNKGETEGGKFVVRNSRFENNRSASLGGAIMAWGYNQDKIIISDSEIINNEVIANSDGEAKGGGLWLMGFVEMDNTIVANNKSADRGGGLYIHGEVPAKISNSDFSGNKAVNGGAIYDGLWDSSIEINNTNFDSNSATNQAGVFYSKNNRPVSLQNSRFINNTPDDSADVSFKNNVSDIRYGSNSDDKISGTKENSYLVGLSGKDTLEGKEGNDYLNGGDSADNLFGGDGSDTLIGGGNANKLFGGNGDDVFIGGRGQDVIEGGSGKDRYIVGNENQMFYTDYNWYDHAIITDFDKKNDTIQLKGKASNYTIKDAKSKEFQGTGIFYKNGLITLVADISAKDFNLNGSYISYTSQSNNSGVNSPDGSSVNSKNDSSDSSQLQLKDSQFTGKPDYNPTNHDGLIIWNTDDTWHVHATGDRNGSSFTGKIIADNSIDDLNLYKLENSDQVELDSSNRVLEFDLWVGQKWTDGVSFKVPEGTSLALDLGEDSDVSVKAGSDLQEVNLI